MRVSTEYQTQRRLSSWEGARIVAHVLAEHRVCGVDSIAEHSGLRPAQVQGIMRYMRDRRMVRVEYSRYGRGLSYNYSLVRQCQRCDGPMHYEVDIVDDGSIVFCARCNQEFVSWASDCGWP